MENFFNWITKPIEDEEVKIWLDMNNIIPEKCDLFLDFCMSLLLLIKQTYLGEDNLPNETKINLSEEDKKKHFHWCWVTTIENFKKENLEFKIEGDHYDYFISFFMEIFYNQKNMTVKNSLDSFFQELFDRSTPFTKSDLDLLTELYKLLDKNMEK